MKLFLTIVLLVCTVRAEEMARQTQYEDDGCTGTWSYTLVRDFAMDGTTCADACEGCDDEGWACECLGGDWSGMLFSNVIETTCNY